MTQALCPYCRSALGESDERIVCAGCETPHHRDCYEENGGCTVFGCRCGPEEEPKLHVRQPELDVVDELAPGFAPQPIRVIHPPSLSPLGLGSVSGTPVLVYAPVAPEATRSKSRFVLLGVFLGPLGVHNFYAGFKKKALVQLGITVLSLGYGAPMSWIWAIIDVCTVDRDVRGAPFKS